MFKVFTAVAVVALMNFSVQIFGVGFQTPTTASSLQVSAQTPQTMHLI
jgi:hypothetical protein